MSSSGVLPARKPQLINLEELDDDQLEALKREFERLSARKGRPIGWGAVLMGGGHAVAPAIRADSLQSSITTLCGT
jgi:hypothetical protein